MGGGGCLEWHREGRGGGPDLNFGLRLWVFPHAGDETVQHTLRYYGKVGRLYGTEECGDRALSGCSYSVPFSFSVLFDCFFHLERPVDRVKNATPALHSNARTTGKKSSLVRRAFLSQTSSLHPWVGYTLRAVICLHILLFDWSGDGHSLFC